jgi:hypothetical protein
MDLAEVIWVGVPWIGLSQDMDKWEAPVVLPKEKKPPVPIA